MGTGWNATAVSLERYIQDVVVLLGKFSTWGCRGGEYGYLCVSVIIV